MLEGTRFDVRTTPVQLPPVRLSKDRVELVVVRELFDGCSNGTAFRGRPAAHSGDQRVNRLTGPQPVQPDLRRWRVPDLLVRCALMQPVSCGLGQLRHLRSQ